MIGDDRLIVESITGADVDLPIAGPGGRSYAFVIDFHIRGLLAIVWLMAVPLLSAGAISLTGSAEDISAGFWVFWVLPAAMIFFLYHPVLEILMKGSTPGKRLAGIRIVDRRGAIPTTGALLVRNIFRLIDSLPALYLIGLAVTVGTKQSVRIGDLAAGTLLVYQQKQKASSFDGMDKLHGDDADPVRAELIQDVLSRWSGLDSRTRRVLAVKLLGSPASDIVSAEDDDLRIEIAKLLN